MDKVCAHRDPQGIPGKMHAQGFSAVNVGRGARQGLEPEKAQLRAPESMVEGRCSEAATGSSFGTFQDSDLRTRSRALVYSSWLWSSMTDVHVLMCFSVWHIAGVHRFRRHLAYKRGTFVGFPSKVNTLSFKVHFRRRSDPRQVRVCAFSIPYISSNMIFRVRLRTS